MIWSAQLTTAPVSNRPTNNQIEPDMNNSQSNQLGGRNAFQPPEYSISDYFRERLESPRIQSPEKRYTGTVVSWVPSPAYGHHGYILCDPESKIAGMVLVNSTSLRDPGTMLHAGDKVNFRPLKVSRGYLATDVIPFVDLEEEQGIEPEVPGDFAVGVLRHVDRQRYFGILELSDGRTALLHFSDLQNPDDATRGVTIKCQIEESIVRGMPRLEAHDATIVRTTMVQRHRREGTPGDNWLDKALLAREEGKYSEAAEIYEQGMKASPQNLQLLLSYAAMERSLKHPEKAAAIFKRGLERFPENPKLYEDFALLLASDQDFSRAIELLENALRIARRQQDAPDKGILLNLARTYFKMGEVGNPGAFGKASAYFRQAEMRFGSRGLPFITDRRSFGLAIFRSQHHRAEVTVNFFRRAGFEILSAQLLPEQFAGGDLVVRTQNKELTENYGLSNQFLVRCIFDSEVSMMDLLQFEEKIKDWAKENGREEFVAFVAMASLTPGIQRELNRRILDRREGAPAIVPISQSEMETTPDQPKALRTTLDKWLFRRDLFAANAPVQGEDRFFGRTNALSQIGDAVASSKSVGIFGLRKVGKTSLLHEIRRRCMESGDVVLYLDLLAVPEHVTNTDWLYWELANQLRQNTAHLNAQVKWRLGGLFESTLDMPDGFPTSVAFDADLRGILKAIGSMALNPHPKVVLMLDEVERLLPVRLGESGFQGFVAFFSYFRGLSQQTKDFTMIVTAANPSIQEAAQFEARDNPVFNYFQEVYLRLFDPAECQRMLVKLGKGMGIRFESPTCDRIYQLTGGHPFITRMFCSFLAENHTDRPLTVTTQMVDSLVGRYLNLKGDKDFNEIFERLRRDYPEELDVCLELAESENPMAFDVSKKDKVRHLVGYQLVRLDGGDLALSMELMKEWLRSNHVD